MKSSDEFLKLCEEACLNNARHYESLFGKQVKHCENLEDELNRLWVARCKANDAFVDFIALLQKKGYTFKFSELPTKQLELVEISKKQRNKR